MKIKRVRIESARNPRFWYADMIGEEIFVLPAGHLTNIKGFGYEVIQTGVFQSAPSRKFLDTRDCKVLEEFEGNVLHQTNISIERQD